MKTRYLKLEARCWRLDVRNWMLDVRNWRLEARDWMLDIRWLDVRNWKLEVRNWRLEVGDWKLDIRWLEVRNWRLEARDWMLDIRWLDVRNWMLEVKCWKLDSRWLDVRNRMSNFYLLTTIIFILNFAISIESKAQTLDDYFKIAAENNPGLQAKYKNFEAAMQRVTQVSSLPDPNLSFGYFISPVETRVGPQRAKFSLTQMFPWFGTLKAQKDAATFMAEAKYQEFLDARNQLYFQVSAAYYPIFELQKLVSIEEENMDILSSYKDITTIKFQNGKGAMVDVLRVDIMLNDALSNLSILKLKKKPLETRFNKLLNRQENEAIIIQDSLFIISMPSEYRKDSLLISNPLLDELDLKIQASNANEQIATKQGLPKIGVGLDYVIVGQRTDMTMPDNGKDVFMPMVTVSLPIFRGKYKASKKEAQLMQESFTLQKDEVSNRLISSYEMVWFEIQKQLEFMALYETQIQESKQSLNLLFSAYSNSGKDFEEILRMQQQILKYQKMEATALTEYHIALAQLDYITAKTK